MHTRLRSRILVRFGLVLLALTAILALGQPARAGSIIYVIPGGTGDGSSWANGKDLATALTAANSGDELWVKTGTYKPTTGADRTATFQLKSGVALYGGFAGTENLRSQRNWQTNVTVLSGDLNGDDRPNFANNSDNSYHVVTGSGTASTAILDGFTVSGGNANTDSYPTNTGGGMFNDGGSPTLTNLIFSANSASDVGGGISNEYGSSPTLTNVTFSGNFGVGAGGMFNLLDSSPTLTNVTFSGNSSNTTGGGMYNGGNSTPILTNVTFSGNSATFLGGGMDNDNSSPTLTNVTFSGNSARDGGGMYNRYPSSPTIRNSILWGDSGGEMSGSASVTYSIVQQAAGVYPGVGNLNADPLFITSITAPAPTTTGNLRLQYASPAINAGDPTTTFPPPADKDPDGNPRIVGGTVDMGAYESPCPAQGSIIYVNASAAGSNNGTSWSNAYTTLTAALAGVPTTPANACAEIWVAQGTYKPTPTTDRTATFSLKNNLAIYGGFISGQTGLSQRNAIPASNNTVLSGDIGTIGNNADNSYHVVTGSNTDSTAILDGFTVSGGNSGTNGSGGGMLNSGGNPTLTNVTFSGNSATYGGGMFKNGGSPTLTNVTFSGNSATYGGGMDNIDGSPTLTNVTFSGNSATYGGGMYTNGASPTLTNVTFSGNYASQGGGIFIAGGSPTIRNSILWGDSGGEMSGSASVTYSIVQQASGVYPGTGNLNADPMFQAPVPSPAPSSGGNLRLQYASPAINRGNNSVTAPSLPATDLDGNPRIVGGTVDMGAYESPCPTQGSIIYVNASVSGGLGDGSSWPNAYTTLTAALAGVPTMPANACAEIWVAQGTYKPAGPNRDRNATFALKNNLALYGGFTSGQTKLGQRNAKPSTNNTMLSGDLNGDDRPNFANNSDNSYHVVTGSGTASTAILDGFTVTGGNANTDGYPTNTGGGMFNDGGSPTLTNLIFSANSASDVGGGISNEYGSSPTLTNVTFSGNFGVGAGGMFNLLDSSPTLTNVTFSGNSSNTTGGGMYNGGNSTPILTNVTFSGNSATFLGGGMDNDNSSPTLTNVTFSGNSARDGGGMYNRYPSSPTIRNSILWGDSGGEMSGSASVTYSIVQQAAGVYPGVGNLNADPLFITSITAPAPTTAGNLRLQTGSPAFNKGNNAVTNPSLPATDLDGNPRIMFGIVDMGAYELQYSVSFVSPTVGPPSVNSLYPTNIGTTATPVKWTLKNGAGQAVTAAGTVTAVSYKINPGCATPFPTDPTGATAASVTSANPKYDVMQKLWVYNWVLPGRGCYTLFITLNGGQVVPLFYHIY
ncbi:MAG: right-handed parallel beta-helix repeat-containing protein [Anaerolineae bacterium]